MTKKFVVESDSSGASQTAGRSASMQVSLKFQGNEGIGPADPHCNAEPQTGTDGAEFNHTPNAFITCLTLLKPHALEIARAQGTSPTSLFASTHRRATPSSYKCFRIPQRTCHLII